MANANLALQPYLSRMSNESGGYDPQEEKKLIDEWMKANPGVVGELNTTFGSGANSIVRSRALNSIKQIEAERSQKQLPKDLASMADPFAGERKGYIDRLRTEVNKPKDPFYEDRLRSEISKPRDPFYEDRLRGEINQPQDPFYEDQVKSTISSVNPYRSQFDALLANPGGIETSPFFKYLQDTQMNQVKASNAAGGFTNSGRGLMALQDRAAGVASQAFFPYANLLQGAGSQFETQANQRAGTIGNLGAQQASQRLARQGQLGTLAGQAEQQQLARQGQLGTLAVQSEQQRLAGQAQLGGFAGAGVNPASGADAYLKTLIASNTPVSGGSSRSASPRQPLGSMTQQSLPSPQQAQPQAPNSYGLPDGGFPTYQPSAGAGTGYINSDYGTTQFTPGDYGQQLSSYLPAVGGYDPNAGYDPNMYEEESWL